MNKVFLLGNIGADPEIKSMNAESRVARLRLATTERWKDQSGERKERTEWHTVVIYNQGLVGVVERFVKKGSKILIQGKLETREWTDGEGKKRYSTEVVLRGYGGELQLVDSRQDGGERRDEGRSNGSSRSQGGQQGNRGRTQKPVDDALPDSFPGNNEFYEDRDDEIPF